MWFCGDYGPHELGNSCVRATWGALSPAAVVFALCACSIPIPAQAQKFLAAFKTPQFLSLHEAEALHIVTSMEEENRANGQLKASSAAARWRSIVFALVGTSEALLWGSLGCYRLFTDPTNIRECVCLLLLAISWLYTVIRAVSHPTVTAPLVLFSFYLVAFATGILQLGGYIFDHIVDAAPLPSKITISVLSATMVATALLLVVVMTMPLGIPGSRVDKDSIGNSVTPEDYTTLFGWITFSWIYPLVRRGRYSTLNEQDVWNPSPTMQSSPVFVKFNEIRRSSLFRRLWAMNSHDIILDFLLTLVTVILSYGGPFFLKRILDAVDVPNPTSETRGKAYIYAILAFVCNLLKAQTEVLQHWHCRRAAMQMRCALMASIYDKALKRQDLSGIINKEKEKNGEGRLAKINPAHSDRADSKLINSKNKEDKKHPERANNAKAGAGIGKIVSMMSGDINRLSRTITGASVMYGAPFEIIIAGAFLYQLLGLSAFAGLIILVAVWPLNSYVSKRSIAILKGTIAARDKRMSVLNELIGAVKLIKFYAWEERWIGRALNARELEIQWLIKARINYVMFYSLWTCVPILVSVLSFFVYVMQGNELTISIAFTSIALFNMLRTPLNVMPTWSVKFRRTGVILDRIALYLDEDEVSSQVSSLKKDFSELQSPEDGLGLVKATLIWNEIPKKAKKGKGNDSMRKSIFDNIPNLLSFRSSRSPSSKDGGTTVADVSIDPQAEDRTFVLRDINIRIPEGELTVVTGPTASGKTAFLMALLGEMTLMQGKIIITKDLSKIDEHGFMHSISYAAQTPWIRHQSIKDNILFGYPYDEDRYNAVIRSCALKPDLEALEDGDATEIGARGINLSGGQKARVALARAVYVRSKYVLLDDPLSAVDSHTARLLYENLLCGPLLKKRTVILVTHHIELVLPGAHYLVRLLGGRIDMQGPTKELREQGILDDITEHAALKVQTAKELTVNSEILAIENIKDTGNNLKRPRKLIEDEHQEIGGVKWSVYNKYLMASSYWIWGFLVMLVVASQLLSVTDRVWIMIWGSAYEMDTDGSSLSLIPAFLAVKNEDPIDKPAPYRQRLNISQPDAGLFGIRWPNAVQHPLFYIGIYAIIGLAKVVVNIFSIIAQYTAALRASRKLFKELLTTVIRATFRFHDTTPQGRILNRFGKDIETVDSSLASSLQSFNSSAAGFFAAILTIAIVFPYFLIPALFIGIAYRELAIGYLRTSRDLRRLDANTMSPILSEFGELLEGVVTVRAFSVEKRFLDNLLCRIDTTTKMWYSFYMISRWVFLNFDVLGALAVLVTMLLSIATLTNKAGLAGLCITSAMSFTLSVYWACRFWTGLEVDLNSVERVVEYLDLPQEPPAIIESNRVPAYWPSTTNKDAFISVENLVVKYAPDLPAVLQDVSFTVKSGERVGILGRTGSGKSTVAMSILRFVDPVSGRIVIDGIDISTIGTYDLRSRLTFIPQDATLFSGTLRENLDPFDEYEDSQVLDALYRVHMIDPNPIAAEGASGQRSAQFSSNIVEGVNPSGVMSTTLPDVDSKRTITLDTQVSAAGANFSQGQRQLVAMARALLRRSPIIVLDEATSSIDFETDAKIQVTIREEFTDCLLLTVAHRLRTVIDYDRLIVLDNGQIAEFDTPWNLISKEDGIFRNMCLNSGSFGELEAAAKAKAGHD